MQFQKPFWGRIATLKNLPTLPHILLKLIKSCDQDKVSLNELSKITEKDPSLSSKVLRLINSAYYGLPHRIESIDHAVLFLGGNAIKNIAISASVYQAFDNIMSNNVFNLKLFWWHSLRCAIIARLTAKKTGYSRPDEAFLSGLLHDIGRLALWVNFPKEYSELLEKYKDRSDLLIAGEIMMGASHSEVGTWLLHRWEFQSFMTDSVLYHHEPIHRILNSLPLVQIVYVANALSQTPAQKDDQGCEIAEKIFKFTGSEVEEMLSRADKELAEVALSLEIEIEPPEVLDRPFSEKDHKKQEDLISEVRDTSLLLGTLQNILEAQDEDTILEVVQQGLQILFDIKSVFFFLYDSEKESLIGKTVSKDKRLSIIKDLIIPIQMESSLLITSLKKETPLDSFRLSRDSELIILDKQIARFIGKEGIFCLPMVARGEYVGVIVFGIDEVETFHILNHLNMLTLFTSQAAKALYIEHLKRTRLKTIQCERIRASSAIARKVVHEVNNPLGIIKNYLKILEMKLSDKNIVQDEISIINEEIDRVVHMLGQLNLFSRDNVRKIEPVDINLLLSNLVKIMGESLITDSRIKINLDLEHSLPAIMTEKDGLKQVFINLIKNSAEAMPGGGNINIRTRYISSRLGNDLIDSSRKYVEIIISDDGPGISDEIKSRLFEPFVSSKGGDHAGLGLSIVHSFIKDLNGIISYENDIMPGAGFKIVLPQK